MDSCYCITHLAESRCSNFDGQTCNYQPGKSAIRNIVDGRNIVEGACHYFGFDIRVKSRITEVDDARKMTILILREDYKMSLNQIGAIVRSPAMHHASVLNQVRKGKDLLQFNAPFRARFDDLKKTLGSKLDLELKEIANLCLQISNVIYGNQEFPTGLIEALQEKIAARK